MKNQDMHISNLGPEGIARRVYNTLDELLSPAVLAAVAGQPIAAVNQIPFSSSDGKSGSHFFAVELGGDRERYIVKRLSLRWDWIMRVTDDSHCRPVVAWETGLLDRIPPGIVHGTIACAVDGDGWALLMQDLSEVMIPPGDEPIAQEENALFLDSMAALHAAFWDAPTAADPALGFCDLWHRYAVFTPPVISREAEGPDPVPRLVLDGWRLFPSLVDPSVAQLMRALHEDVQPLVDALSRYPQTVNHGDWKLGNLGVIRQRAGTEEPPPQPRVVLLDWATTGPAPPAADLAWYLALNSARLPVPKEACIELYRESLSRRLGDRFDARWWRPQLELCLLGAFVQFGWEKSLGAVHGESEDVRARERTEINWWSEQFRAGSQWL